jgi:hypothetical protein
LVSLLFSVAEFSGCALVQYLTTNKELGPTLFTAARFLEGAEQDKEFGLTAVFCLQSFMDVQLLTMI